MSDTNLVPEGTRVRYHGSMTEYHGEMTVIAAHPEMVPTHGEYSPVRYALQYGPSLRDYIHNVRPESFTVIGEEENGHA